MIQDDPEPARQTFNAAKDNPLVRMRLVLWLISLSQIPFMMFTAKGSIVLPFALSLPLLLLAAFFEWRYRALVRPGLPLLVVDDAGIESRAFSGRRKRYAWHEIETVSVESNQGAAYLRFKLAHGAGERAGLFGLGRNDGRATLVLTLFDEAAKEGLLDAIRNHVGAGLPGAAKMVDEFKQQREFEANLKALAPNPWATYALIAVNVAVWLVTLALGGSLLQVPAEKLYLWGGNSASAVQNGEWWRLLTATFLHSGMMHIAMNMIGLWSIGILVERIYGARLFLLIYFGAGLIGSALSLHYAAQKMVSVGASGAVFGIAGALLVAVWQHRDKIPQSFSRQMLTGMGLFVVYSLAQGLGKTGIDNAAHIGGLLGGVLLAAILPERFDMAHYCQNYAGRALLGLVVAMAATVGLTVTAPEAPFDLRTVFASEPHLRLGMNQFSESISALQQEAKDIKAGRIGERESDERSRAVYAPEFRKVSQELAQVTLAPDDPRGPLVRDTQRAADVLAELLGMDSREVDGHWQPVDLVRATELKTELDALGKTIQADADAVKKAKK